MNRVFALLLSAAICSPTHGAQSRFLEEVIVTAEKVAKSAQETPMSITALDERFMEDVGISDVDDLSLFVPSFSRTRLDLSIRGIGRTHRTAGGETGVAIYQNGIYSDESVVQGSEGRYYDLQRVEVLRGPQGTLYGRNAIGGVVNYVFNPPSHEFFAEVQSRGGANNLVETNGVLNGSLIRDVLSARLVGTHFHQGADRDSRAAPGHVPLSDTGRSEDSSIAISLDFTPTDNTSVLLRVVDRYINSVPRANLYIGEGLGDRTVRYNGACFPVGIDCFNEPLNDGAHVRPALNPNAHQNLPVSGNGYGEDLDNSAYPDTKQEFVASNNHYFLDAQHHFDYGRFTLRYLAGHAEIDADVTLDGFTGTGGRNTCLPPRCEAGSGGELVSAQEYAFVNRQRQTTHELQLISNLDGPLNFVGGLFYQTLERELNLDARNAAQLGTYTDTPSFGQLLNREDFPPSIGPRDHNFAVNTLMQEIRLFGGSPGGTWYWYDTEARTRATAAYAQLTWELSENWELSAGARWLKDEKRGSERRWLFIEFAELGIPFELFNELITTDPVTGLPNGDPFRLNGLPLEILDGVETQDEWTKVTGHVGVRYQPNKHNLIYANATSGYRSGGFNLGFNQPVSFEDEDVVSFEIGWKTTLFDRLTLGLSAYRYQYKDHQIQSNLDVPATSYLCEGEGCPAPGDTFVLSGAIATVPEALNFGAEIEAVWAATDALTIGATYSYISTEITSDFFIDVQDNEWAPFERDEPLNVKGVALNRAPEHKFTAWFNQTISFGDWGRIDAFLLYAYVGEQNNNLVDSPINRSPAYERWDARIRWESATERYSVSAFVKNATDELGIVELFAGENHGRVAETTAPRSWGIEFRVRFGNWNQSAENIRGGPIL